MAQVPAQVRLAARFACGLLLLPPARQQHVAKQHAHVWHVPEGLGPLQRSPALQGGAEYLEIALVLDACLPRQERCPPQAAGTLVVLAPIFQAVPQAVHTAFSAEKVMSALKP